MREPARLLHRGALVVALIVGVLGMHSLMLMGMPTGVSTSAVSAPAVSSLVVVGDPASGMSMPVRVSPPAATSPLGVGPHLSTTSSALERVVMPGAHECLAVLVAAAAVLLLVLAGRAGWSSRVAQVIVVVGRAGRAPPWRTPALTQLSVLRV